MAPKWILPILNSCLDPQEQSDSRILLSEIQTKISSGTNLKLSFQQLRTSELKRLKAQLGDSVFHQVASLSQETHPRIFFQDALRLAGRFTNQGKWQEATQLYDFLRRNPDIPQDLKARARERYDAITGKGDFFASFDIRAQQFFQNATHPRTIVPLMLGSLGSQWVYTRLLGRMANSTRGFWAMRGLTARATAASLATLGETSIILGSNRSLAHLTGSPQLPLSHELASTLLMLGVFKTVGFGSTQLFHRVHRTAELSPWALGTPLYRTTRYVFPHLSTISALMLAHGLESRFGLRPSGNGQSLFWGALESWATLSVGARLGHQFLPHRLKQAQLQWGMANQIYYTAKSPPPQGPTQGRFPWQSELAFAGAAPIPLREPKLSRPHLMANTGDTLSGVLPKKFPHQIAGFPGKDLKITLEGEKELVQRAQTATDFGNWHESIKKLRALYLRNFIKARSKMLQLQAAEKKAAQEIENLKLHHQLVATNTEEGTSTYGKIGSDDFPFAIDLSNLPGPSTSRVALNPFHPEIGHPMYYRIKDLKYFQEVVSEQGVADYATAIRNKKNTAPIKIAYRPETGYFIYDGYHRMMAALETGNTHILGTRVRHFSPFSTGPVSLASIRKIPHKEYLKIIQQTDNEEINPYLHSIFENWTQKD